MNEKLTKTDIKRTKKWSKNEQVDKNGACPWPGCGYCFLHLTQKHGIYCLLQVLLGRFDTAEAEKAPPS